MPGASEYLTAVAMQQTVLEDASTDGIPQVIYYFDNHPDEEEDKVRGQWGLQGAR